MLEVRATTAQVRRAYDAFSRVYGALLSPLHRGTLTIVLERARIAPGDRLLEVAIGPATSFVDACRRAQTLAVGLDLSWPMLRRARRRLQHNRISSASLLEADARSLPFAAASFDLVLSCHFLDLLPERDIQRVLREFYRVLKPGGRLVTANMSKARPEGRSLWERLYESLPAGLTAYLLGACRPVFAAEIVTDSGFINIRREFFAGAIRSEIVSAEKPASG